MLTLEFVAVSLMSIGIIIIGVTFYVIKNNVNESSTSLTIGDIDKHSQELNEMAISIYKELDDKYKEILVIYNLIEKKHSEIKNDEFKAVYHQAEQTNNIVKNTNYSSNIQRMADISKEFERKQETEYGARPDDNLALKVLNKNLVTESKENKKPAKQRDVEALLKRGFSLEQIAKDLNIGMGEVQLIAELMKVKNE